MRLFNLFNHQSRPIKLYHFLAFSVFLFTFIVYLLSCGKETPYNYFVRLAEAFLNHRLYLTENPSWLNELIPLNGRYYVVFPPMPAVIILPLVALFGSHFSQTLFSIFLGSFNSLLFWLILEKLGRRKKEKTWLILLFSLGNIYWYLASVGSAWYLAHISAAFFLLLALNEALGRKRPFLTGLLLGAAYWSRLPTIFSAPFFLYLISQRRKKVSFGKTISRFGLGLLIFLFANAGYNYLRFGAVYDVGYSLIPGVLDEPWYERGLVNLGYLPHNFRVFMFQLPKLLKQFPYLIPSHAGQGIVLTTPAFIFALQASWKNRAHLFAWASILVTLVFVLCHGASGFSQFGFRFATDFYPLLFFLTARGVGKKIRWYHQALIAISVLINLWGVVMINKVNLVSY